MKVCLVTESYAPRVDGVAISVRTLVSGLRSRGRNGTDVTVLAPAVRHFRRSRIRSRYSWLKTPYDDYPLPLVSLGQLRDFMHQLAPDVVHLETQGVLGLLTLMACSDLGIPVIVTFHTDLVAYSNSYRTAPVLGALATAVASTSTEVFRRLRIPRTVLDSATIVHLLIEWMCDVGAAVIVPSEKMRDVLARDGCAATQVIPTPRQLPSSGKWSGQTTARLPSGSRYFCYVGRVSREKNIPVLLEAFSRAFGSQSDTYLVIAGSGSVLPALQGRARKMGIAPRVRFTGVLDEHEVAALMRDAVAFVQPSVTDTQCLAMWEAASVGTPAVIRDPALATPGSVIEDKLTCIVAPNVEDFSGALKTLVVEPLVRSGLGDRARLRSQLRRYSVDSFVERHLSIYSSATHHI